MSSKMIRTAALAVLFMLSFSLRVFADTIPTLTLDPPNGALTGPAGSTVGWGFTLANPGNDFLVVSGSDFCVGIITSPCSNALGTYTDFAGQQFFVFGPAPEDASLTQAFDNTLQLGMGSFLINPGATGSVNGFIALSYDLFSVDPNSLDFNPDTDTISNGNILTAPASVTVGAVSSAPEPPALALLLGALGALLFLRKRP